MHNNNNNNNNKGPNNCPDLKFTRGVWFQFWDGTMDTETSACAGWGPRVYTQSAITEECDQRETRLFWLCFGNPTLQLRELLTKTFSTLLEKEKRLNLALTHNSPILIWVAVVYLLFHCFIIHYNCSVVHKPRRSKIRRFFPSYPLGKATDLVSRISLVL